MSICINCHYDYKDQHWDYCLQQWDPPCDGVKQEIPDNWKERQFNPEDEGFRGCIIKNDGCCSDRIYLKNSFSGTIEVMK